MCGQGTVRWGEMTYQVIASLNRPALGILERDDTGAAVALLVEGRRVKPPRSDDYREISVCYNTEVQAHAAMEEYLDGLIS
jgi:hypothetical protein